MKGNVMENVLQTNGLTKKYGRFTALKNVTMTVPKGAIYGLVGKNGAGKTTIIRIVCGLHNASDGELSLYGISNRDKKITQMRKKISAVVETPAIYPNLSAKNNLLLQYKLTGKNPDKIDELLNLVGIPDTGKKKAKDFSLGMRQRLGIAFSLVNEPDFLVLDEPINGLDPQGIVEVRELLLKLNREKNMTILISSHILDELSKLATHYGFVDKGTIVKEMSSEELENAVKKSMLITVNNTMLLAPVLMEKNLDYKIVSETEAEIYSHINVTTLVHDLAEKGCEVITMTEKSESLESYYMSLVGGADNA